MMLLGYILSSLIGIVLGMFGAGGAIISFPILVYFMNIPPTLAGNYSLIIVGIAAISGIIQNIQHHTINFKVAGIFTLPLLISFYITKTFILPQIPEHIIQINNVWITKDNLLMSIFVILLSIIIFNMLAQNKEASDNNLNTTDSYKFSLKYLLDASLVGVLAASIGAGGGFIIVPALMKVFKLSIKQATSTSLLIIAANAIVGTVLNSTYFVTAHIPMLIILSLISIIGIFIGSNLKNHIHTSTLKNIYAYFLMIILFTTLFTEIYKKYH